MANPKLVRDFIPGAFGSIPDYHDGGLIGNRKDSLLLLATSGQEKGTRIDAIFSLDASGNATYSQDVSYGYFEDSNFKNQFIGDIDGKSIYLLADGQILADDPIADGIYRITSAAGTIDDYYSEVVVAGDRLFQTDDSGNLWRLDGSAGQTLSPALIANTGQLEGFQVIAIAAAEANEVLFTKSGPGSYAYRAKEVWATNDLSTTKVFDVAESYTSNSPDIRLTDTKLSSTGNLFTVIGNGSTVFNPPFFPSTTSSYTYNPGFIDLWLSDGTAAGTRLIKSIAGADRPIELESESFAYGNHYARSAQFSQSLTLLSIGTELYNSERRYQTSSLWSSDGTESGTIKLRDFEEIGSYDDDDNDWLVKSNPFGYFIAQDKDSISGLWRTDGTASGTILLTPWNGSEYISESSLAGASGDLYFINEDATHGRELWKTDGTQAGTSLLKDIRPGTASSEIRDLIRIGNEIYFTASDGIHGRELWKSDGTAEGTSLVVDLVPGLMGSGPDSLTALGNSLYFWADDRVHGNELWMIDLTQPVSIDTSTPPPDTSSNTTNPTSSTTNTSTSSSTDPSAIRTFQAKDDDTYIPQSGQIKSISGRLEINSKDNSPISNETYLLTAASELVFNRGYQAINPTLRGSAQADNIFLNDALVSGGRYELGEGADRMAFLGSSSISKTTIALGKDKLSDVITFATAKSARGVTLSEFGKQDKLVIGGKTLTFAKLKKQRPTGIKVKFQSSSAKQMMMPTNITNDNLMSEPGPLTGESQSYLGNPASWISV